MGQSMMTPIRGGRASQPGLFSGRCLPDAHADPSRAPFIPEADFRRRFSTPHVHDRWRHARTHLYFGGLRVSKSTWHQLLMPLAVLIGCVLLGGCGEEKIPLKKVDFVLDAPPKDYKETRKEFSRKGASSKIGRDPSGVSK